MKATVNQGDDGVVVATIKPLTSAVAPGAQELCFQPREIDVPSEVEMVIEPECGTDLETLSLQVSASTEAEVESTTVQILECPEEGVPQETCSATPAADFTLTISSIDQDSPGGQEGGEGNGGNREGGNGEDEPGGGQVFEVPSTPLERELRDRLNELSFRSSFLELPQEMQLGEETVAELRFPKRITTALTRDLPHEGKVLPVSVSITADLFGYGDFRIEPRSRSQQLITSNSRAAWLWRVLPESSGTRDLSLNIRITIQAIDTLWPREVLPNPQTVIVHGNSLYSVAQFLKANWQWLLGTIAVPLVLWLLDRNRKKIGQ